MEVAAEVERAGARAHCQQAGNVSSPSGLASKLILPGTAVPGFRLLRPCGTASLRHNRLVIPTGADPDFLLRTASNDHVCGSP
jgi:hypothetical protein